MQTRIQATRPQSQEQKFERIRAAGQRARVKLAARGGVENEIDIAHAPLSWWRARWADKAIRRTFIENFIYIRDEFDNNELKLLKFNEAQVDFHNKRTGKDALLKGRKIGFSTYFLASDMADAVVLSGREVRNAVQDPDTEKKFRAVQMQMFENLPTHLRPATREYSAEHIWIHDPKLGTIDSHLVIRNVAAGHEGKGRGQPFTHLRMTEMPHWQGDQKKTVVSLLNAGPNADVSSESTPYGMELFYTTYEDGKKGKGGWTSHCYKWWWLNRWRIPGADFRKARGKAVLLKPGETLKDVWSVLPSGATEARRAANRATFDAAVVTKQEMAVGREIFDHLKRFGYLSQESAAVGRSRKQKALRWNCPEVAEYIAWRRFKIGEMGEKDFLVEYLENDVDCFEQTGRPVVSAQYLKEPCAMAEPKEGRAYLVSADPSLGLESGNPSGVVVKDVLLGQTVLEEKLKRAPDLLAYRLAELSTLYNDAEIAVERNNMGIAVILRLEADGYGDRLYRHMDAPLLRRLDAGEITVDEAKELARAGFPTTAEVKPVAGMMLEESLRQKWTAVGPLFIEEARRVVWLDNGGFAAQQGFEDDIFMAEVIANYVIRMAAAMSSGFIGVLPEVGYAR